MNVTRVTRGHVRQSQLRHRSGLHSVRASCRGASTGFAVAFGILLDTFIVRSVLVTALSLDVGRWMWWPSRLAHESHPAAEEISADRAAVPAG
jgi:hypothetical protein